MSNFYDEVGGEKFFTELVSLFYAQVATDPILRPMYPDHDLQAAARRLQLFLEQYWGDQRLTPKSEATRGFACDTHNFQ